MYLYGGKTQNFFEFFHKSVFPLHTECAILKGRFNLFAEDFKKMYSFKNDYSEGAHPDILKALSTCSGEQNAAYGTDKHSAAAADMIRELCSSPKSGVAFAGGGTPANILAICALLRNPYEAAVCASTGHINVHETGALEYAGHKIIEVPAKADGKLTPAGIESVLKTHASEHMVVPKLVYISQTTENGTIYSKAELSALCDCCRKNGLFLYVDGARLGSALMAEENDVSLADLAAMTDAFCMGGTKNGLLLGEALVMQNEEMQDHLRWIMKQKGFMLAKGFVVGIQFEEALRDGLFFDMAKHANEAAEKIAEAVEQSGFEFFAKPQSNQLFVILPPELAEEAHEKFCCNIDRLLEDGRAVIRIVTSWATTEKAVEEISAWLIKQLCFGLVKSIIEA